MANTDINFKLKEEMSEKIVFQCQKFYLNNVDAAEKVKVVGLPIAQLPREWVDAISRKFTSLVQNNWVLTGEVTQVDIFCSNGYNYGSQILFTSGFGGTMHSDVVLKDYDMSGLLGQHQDQ